MEDYLAEMAAIIGRQSFVTYPHFDRYWTEPESRWPYLLRLGSASAGFALVRLKESDGRFEMAEFFVAPPYRRQGVGTAAARALIACHPGEWRVTQRAANVRAIAFWQRVLGGYRGYRDTPAAGAGGLQEQLFSVP